mmetsp:Transcript_96121/g.286879  ORF Transcript_96121/g.286879 Transcript_96121/m.286879 type:complete len:206 (+) Transcript_96121:691-1308(+)
MYSLKGSNSLRWPSRRTRSMRFCAPAATGSVSVGPERQPNTEVAFGTWSVGGHSRTIFRPPTTVASAWKMSSRTRNTKPTGAKTHCPRQRLLPRTKPRREDSNIKGSRVLMPMPTRPETIIGPFIADLSMLSRTLYGTCPFKQAKEYLPRSCWSQKAAQPSASLSSHTGTNASASVRMNPTLPTTSRMKTIVTKANSRPSVVGKL